LPQGSCCIYSYWPGYLERPQSAGLEQKVASAGARFIKAHTSGHIFAEDTAEFLRGIDPKVVIPIHTFNPEAFRGLGRQVRILNDGEPYEVT
jgi:ribonuclease J